MKRVLNLCLFILAISLGASAKSGWIDVTAKYIVNPSYTNNSKDGWEWWAMAGSVSTDYEIQEFWNGTFYMEQLIEDLPNGHYRVGVQGYYRCGANGNASFAHFSGDEEITAYLVANDELVLLKSVYDEEFDSWQSDCYSYNGMFYPDRMSSANIALNTMDMYHNYLEVDVEDGTLFIQAYNNDWVEDNWVILDNWTLEYWGEVQPVSSLTLSETALSLSVGQQAALSFAATPSLADVSGVTWRSQNEKVATLNTTQGNRVYVTAIAPGTTDIVCRDAATGVQALCRVNVKQYAELDGPSYDMEAFVANPTFDSNAIGWTIGVSRYTHGGFQANSYYNGEASLSNFVETWVPSGNLGSGAIYQDVMGLPDGLYKFEADVVACQQNNANTCYGASLFMESLENGNVYESQCATASGKPQHYSVVGYCEGGTLRIGVQVAEDCNVNWLAMDNVKLTFYGEDPFAGMEEGQMSLVINEIQVANNDIYIDPSFNYGGWVELYNPTDKAVMIGNMCLSDEAANLQKFQLPKNAGTVPAHGYRNVWFDHNVADGNYGGRADLQVRFKLNTEGGTIYLSDGNGNLVQKVAYPAATPRCSYARLTDGGSAWGTTGTPTPEEGNAGSDFATQRLEAPVVSQDAGLFAQGTSFNFTVKIPAGATLLYTTDGSTPSRLNGEVSTDGRFSVSGTSIYRFCLVQDGMLPSPVVTRSYIFKNHDYYLPVISIATHPDNLFGSEIGVYTRGSNGTSGNGQNSPCNWNRDWERPVNMEYMVPQKNQDGTTSFVTMLNQEVDFEISGGWSRGYGGRWTDDRYWDMKSSFRLKTDKRYEGLNEIPYTVFPDKPYNKYKVWQVRNGGNDTNNRQKDPIIQQIVLTSGFDVDCQAYQPSHVFFNGEYLGMLNIRESNNKHFGYSNFGIDTDDMDQFDLSNAQYNQKAGDDEAWLELLARAEQLATSQSEADYEKVKELLDIDEYINYMALECYLGCGDWITNTNNVKGYRSKSDGGKFRFVLFDTDSAFDSSTMFSGILGTGGGANVDDLFRHLVKYPAFCRQFLDAMCLVEGSVCTPERSQVIADRIKDNTYNALRFEDIWPGNNVADNMNYRYKGSIVSNVANDSRMNAGSPYWLNLSSNIEAGQLLVNGQRVPTGKFNGRLYDYKNNGIYLTAQAPAGYRFKGWSLDGGITNSSTQYIIAERNSWWYYDGGSMDHTDWTSPSFDASSNSWKKGVAPLGYATAGKYMATNCNTTLDYGSYSSDKRPTYYFRHSFTLDHAPKADEVYSFTYHVDDGVLVTVNGTEVGTYYYTSGSSYYDYTTGGHYEGDTPASGTFVIPNSLLHKGDNVVAVAVKNTSASSSDIYFDGSLQVTTTEESGFEFVSTDPMLCLTDKPELFTSGNSSAGYTLVARYEEISDAKERLEAGASPVRINEVSAGNDIYINEYSKKEDWVELYNTTDEDIDLAGLYLSDNANKPQKWQISSTASSTILPAHGTRIVWCDELEPINQLHAPFKLDNADGATVSIMAEDGTWADEMTYLSQPRWQTYGRYPDGGNFATLLNVPTIDKSNQYGTIDYSTFDPTDDPEMSVTLELAQGWNWTSHNLADDVSMSRLNAYALEVRSQTKQSIYDELLGWQGSLKNLSKTEGFKVRMREGADVTLRGELFSTKEPVTVLKGWNWIGLPLKNATALSSALKNYKPTSGDQIVGHNAFATYNGYSWTGSLTKLEPGQAYLFKVGQAQDFKWNDLSSSSKVKERRYTAAHRDDMAPWNLNIHAYPNVMTMVAKLDAEELNLMPGYFVGAFCGEECRGVAELVDGLLFMNVHGEGGEDIQFRLLDSEGNQYASRETAEMASMLCLGSTSAPYVLHFGRNDIEDVIRDVMASNGRMVSVQYFSLSGQRINEPKGICVQRTLMSDGTMQVKKVRK